MMPASGRTIAILAAGLTAALLFAQRGAVQAQQPSNAAPSGEQPTFRAGTRLATIDAVVVDKDGRQVTDLTPADFEIIERGKPQAVRQAPYIRVARGSTAGRSATESGGSAGSASTPSSATTPAAPAGAAASATAGSARQPKDRVIAIVVDDLGLSFLSIGRVRQMLSRYVQTQIAPGDLVAIIRTSGGSGALQQFTTDRRLLDASVARIRWTSASRHGIGPFTASRPVSLGSDPMAASANELGARNVDRVRRSDTYEEARVDLTSRGTLGALQYVLRGIQQLPGRKSVVFISEGFDLGLRDDLSSLAWDTFTRVIGSANRAGVVVYTVDPRGLASSGLTAEDIVQPGAGGAGLSDAVASAERDRRNVLFESQDSLIYLAEQTGGFAVVNSNNLSDGMARIADDASGYYLIGVETSLDAAARWNPNDLRVRVKRPGLTLRARRGLFGPTDAARPEDAVPGDPLLDAAMSPFAVGVIEVRLEALFGHDAKTGSYIRSRFSIDPERVSFTDGPDGRRDADLSVVLMALGDTGVPIAQKRWRVELRLAQPAYATLRREGLRYNVYLPIKTPGGYQLRAAVRDDRSHDLGTVAQFVEIPKVAKGQVVLSGVVVMDIEAARRAVAAAGGTAVPAATDGGESPTSEPAVAVFAPGSEVIYAAELYDGRGRRTEALSTQATLLRDGTPLYTTPPTPVPSPEAASQAPAAIPVGGRLTLGAAFPPGSYSLQVTVAPAKGASRPRATRWVDFEVR